MTWFKFLAPDATGPFSGYRWSAPDGVRDSGERTPGQWTAARLPLDPCRSGLHLCREADLPFWLHEELYVADVDGPVVEYESFVLVHRARLVRRVDAWASGSAYRFSRGCAWRVRDLAVDALRGLDRDQDADRLLDCSTIDGLGEAARRIGRSNGIDLTGYVADAAAFAAGARAGNGWASAAATTAFVAATAARAAAGRGHGLAALLAERARQARWIADMTPAVG